MCYPLCDWECFGGISYNLSPLPLIRRVRGGGIEKMWFSYVKYADSHRILHLSVKCKSEKNSPAALDVFRKQVNIIELAAGGKLGF